MDVPLQISFKNMDASDVVEARIREKVAKLEQFFDHIIGCRVVIECSGGTPPRGNLFKIHIDITVPGQELVVSGTGQNNGHEDVYVALKDAFAVASRQLQDFARRIRGDVKAHPARGSV